MKAMMQSKRFLRCLMFQIVKAMDQRATESYWHYTNLQIPQIQVYTRLLRIKYIQSKQNILKISFHLPTNVAKY